MNHSIVMLAVLGAIVIVALLHCLFGYKLARFLLPLCGTALAQAVLYKFVFEGMELDGTGRWLFIAGSALAAYIALFFLPRIAAFFTGLTASALALLYAVYALSLFDMPLVYPIALSLCVLCGLLTAVYKRVGVAVFTAVFGGCIASFAAVFFFYGTQTANYLLSGIVVAPLEFFLRSHALLISGGALALFALGLLIQLKVTANSQLLDRRLPRGAHTMEF